VGPTQEGRWSGLASTDGNLTAAQLWMIP